MTTTRAYRSKIGQLPFKFRHELNNRIRDGHQGAALLDFINTSTQFRSLKRRLKCQPVNAQNLSDWRDSGYRDWLIDQDKAAHWRQVTEYTNTIVAEAGGTPASVGANLLTDKLLTILSEDELPTSDLVKAVVSLKKEETNTRKLALAEQQLELKEREFTLERNKYQRQTCDLFIKWFKSKKIGSILSDKSADNDAKTEALGRHLFGEYWDQAPATAAKR